MRFPSASASEPTTPLRGPATPPRPSLPRPASPPRGPTPLRPPLRGQATPLRPPLRGQATPLRRGPLVVYAALATVALGSAVVQGRSPLSAPSPWLDLPPVLGHAASVVAGVALAVLTVAATRQMVRRFGFARALHAHLRPGVEGAGERALVVLGIASAASEELFFRSLVGCALGIVASSLAFGLLHQAAGRARWTWAIWATVMGFLFAAIFFATGSLLGAITAHAAINVANLRFLRDTDVEGPKTRRLGGLLGGA